MADRSARVIRTFGASLREMSRDAVYMWHAYGEGFSVAIFRLRRNGDAPLPIPRHSHGEEMVT